MIRKAVALEGTWHLCLRLISALHRDEWARTTPAGSSLLAPCWLRQQHWYLQHTAELPLQPTHVFRIQWCVSGAMRLHTNFKCECVAALEAKKLQAHFVNAEPHLGPSCGHRLGTGLGGLEHHQRRFLCAKHHNHTCLACTPNCQRLDSCRLHVHEAPHASNKRFKIMIGGHLTQCQVGCIGRYHTFSSHS